MRLVTAWQDGPTELLSAELFNSTGVMSPRPPPYSESLLAGDARTIRSVTDGARRQR